MAIHYSKITIELREILLKDKPPSMLQVSVKGTVPVLVLPDAGIIDESREIMMWALAQEDPEHWYHGLSKEKQEQANLLIDSNDYQFKPLLDKYKYSTRHPEQSTENYRQEAEVHIQRLDQQLSQHHYLLSDQITIADIAIFPFIRQFAFVNKAWFDHSDYLHLQRWLAEFLESKLFLEVMQKHPVWQDPLLPSS